MITKVGKTKKIDPAVIAAMISRESRAGALLKNGWEPEGNGFGLMQVHYNQWCSLRDMQVYAVYPLGKVKDFRIPT